MGEAEWPGMEESLGGTLLIPEGSQPFSILVLFLGLEPDWLLATFLLLNAVQHAVEPIEV